MSYNQATLATCPRSSGDRASASGAESHRFESCRGHHTFTRCAHTHVPSCIYHSLCCVFALFCIASSILCAAYLLFSTQRICSSPYCISHPLYSIDSSRYIRKKICAARFSTYSTYHFNYGVPYWLQRYIWRFTGFTATTINTLIIPTQRRLRLVGIALRYR